MMGLFPYGRQMPLEMLFFIITPVNNNKYHVIKDYCYKIIGNFHLEQHQNTFRIKCILVFLL